MTVTDTISELLAPVLANLDVEVVDVEYTGAVLRVTVDQEGGINTNLLAKVNRLISPILDEHDPIADRYTLEVSSPGVERKLNRPEHFERAVGEGIIVKMVPGVEPRRMKGTLKSTDETSCVISVIEIDGVDQPAEEHSVNFDDVLKARTYYDFGPTSKAEAKKKKPHQQKPKPRAAKGPGRAAAKNSRPTKGSAAAKDSAKNSAVSADVKSAEKTKESSTNHKQGSSTERSQGETS